MTTTFSNLAVLGRPGHLVSIVTDEPPYPFAWRASCDCGYIGRARTIRDEAAEDALTHFETGGKA